MDAIYILPLVIIGFLFLCFIMAKTFSATFLPDKYSELKQKYPYPLHSYSWLSGNFKFGLLSFRMRPLKIDVYEKMIIISAIGQGLCLPYNKFIFEQKQILFSHVLVVKTLPESSEYQEKSKTILEIAFLSEDKINTILSLVHK